MVGHREHGDGFVLHLANDRARESARRPAAISVLIRCLAKRRLSKAINDLENFQTKGVVDIGLGRRCQLDDV